MNTFKMKNTSLLFFLIFSTPFLFGQESDDVQTYQNEWGLNITGFANQFLSINGSTADPGSFLLTYKRIKKNQAFRTGLGLFLNFTNTDENANESSLESNSVNISLRLGMEKHFPIERKWLFTAGGDLILNYSDFTSGSLSNFGDVTIKNSEWSVGLGPVLGVHFRINQRISLGTEGTLYIRYFDSNSETDFGDFGGSNNNDSTGFSLNMNTPLALYFSVRL